MHTVEIPRLTVADILVELERLILCQHADSLDAGIDAVGERKVDDPVFTSEGYGGLCDFLGENAETRTLTAGKQHRYYFFLRYHYILQYCLPNPG